MDSEPLLGKKFHAGFGKTLLHLTEHRNENPAVENQ